jgi:probable HAF family extracellular repeat protein
LKRRVLVLIAISLFTGLSVSSSAQQAQSATFQMIDIPANTWVNYAISADGKVLGANVGGEIFRWTAEQGFVDLGAGDFLNSSIGISADGSTIAATILGPDGYTNPGRWRETTGWVSLGYTAKGCVMDGNWGSGYGLNHDGSVVVGLAWYCPGAQGFRWTEGRGMVGLSHPKGASSRASAISADGSTIVGFYEHPKQGIRRAVRWTPRFDLFTGVDVPGEATAVSSNGSQIVGQAATVNGIYAFYYADAAGLISLGTVSGIPTDQSIANGISDKGKVVGWSGDPFFGGLEAFIWSAARPTGKMRSLRKVLTQAGAQIPDGIYLTNALAISADGSTVVGTWQDDHFNQGTWMARLK